MRILLLEDNATDAGLTLRTLKKNIPACEIEHATHLKMARDFLNNPEKFDIALLDMELPDGNGMNILMEIRQKQLNMAVAMLTGSGDEEVATAALKAGADDYMVKKPGYVSKIPQLVEFAIENHKNIQRQDSNFIRILYIEHNAADVDLTNRYLNRYAPYIQIKNVATGEEAIKLLPDNGADPEKWEFQVILMDYRLPGMSALEFIKEIRQERKLDFPILIVTGQGSEEVVVQSLKLGASEYLVKRENYLKRLPSLITSAYRYCELERKQKALKASEAKYRLLAENSGDVIFTLDFDLNYTYVSPAITTLRGYTPEEVLNHKIKDALTPASYRIVKKTLDRVLPEIMEQNVNSIPLVLELEMYKKDRTSIWVEVKISILTNPQGKPIGILGVSRDISKRRKVQEELRKLSQAVTQNPVSITITDIAGNIEYVNPKFTKLSGYSLEEVKGKNTRILKSGQQTTSYYKELWDTILSGKDWHGEIQNKKKNGELYWVSAIISPLVNNEGKITHFVAIKEDISARKEMEQIQKILVNISDAVVSNRSLDEFFSLLYAELTSLINTKNFYIALYNEQTKIFSTIFMLGTKEDKIVDFPAGKTLSNYVLIKKESLFIDKKTLSQLIKNGEIELIGPPSEIWIGVPLFQEDAVIGVMVIQNYEGEKTLTKDDLKLLEFVSPSISLAIERKRFIEDLKIEKVKAQAADQLKTAFLNNISHEVRTPLNGILGFGEIMAEAEVSKEERFIYLDILRKSSTRLINTITSYMDISLIVSRNMSVNKKYFDAMELLDTLYHQYLTEAKEKGLELVLETDTMKEAQIDSDPALLKKILSHLLDNAFKFSKEGMVKFGCRNTNERIGFFVQDEGIGIEADKIDSIFDYFTQADIGISRGYEGSGLGLSISKGLVEILGGEISIKSEKTKGTTVEISFESKTKNETVLAQNSVEETSKNGTMVLIAEDDPVNSLYIQTILHNAGIRSIVVQNGKEAVDKVKTDDEIGLVLMDLKMPLMNGFVATKKIKLIKPNLPIIAITAYAMPGDEEQARKAGCDDYLAKPFTSKVLLKKLEAYELL